MLIVAIGVSEREKNNMFPVEQPEIKTTLFRKYRILNKDTDYQNVVSMLNVLQRAKANMTKPLMFHFVSEIDIDTFQTDRFIQMVKECFKIRHLHFR